MFFSLQLYLFFHHFFCMNKQYFCQTFFLTKNTIEIYLIYWNLFLWIFSDCLAFDRNPTEKLHITYQYCYQLLMLLLGRISPGAIISQHLKIQFLGLEKDLTIWMFTVWESLCSYHKSESSIPQYIFILYIFQKFSYFKKLQNTISQKMF